MKHFSNLEQTIKEGYYNLQPCVTPLPEERRGPLPRRLGRRRRQAQSVSRRRGGKHGGTINGSAAP